jgi:hypothetical protein
MPRVKFVKKKSFHILLTLKSQKSVCIISNRCFLACFSWLPFCSLLEIVVPTTFQFSFRFLLYTYSEAMGARGRLSRLRPRGDGRDDKSIRFLFHKEESFWPVRAGFAQGDLSWPLFRVDLILLLFSLLEIDKDVRALASCNRRLVAKGEEFYAARGNKPSTKVQFCAVRFWLTTLGQGDGNSAKLAYAVCVPRRKQLWEETNSLCISKLSFNFFDSLSRLKDGNPFVSRSIIDSDSLEGFWCDGLLEDRVYLSMGEEEEEDLMNVFAPFAIVDYGCVFVFNRSHVKAIVEQLKFVLSPQCLTQLFKDADLHCWFEIALDVLTFLEGELEMQGDDKTNEKEGLFDFYIG